MFRNKIYKTYDAYLSFASVAVYWQHFSYFFIGDLK